MYCLRYSVNNGVEHIALCHTSLLGVIYIASSEQDTKNKLMS